MAKSYKRLPEIPEEMQERYRVMVEVLSGKLTVREGASRLGLSRNQFQSLLHRGLEGLLGGISTHPGGRPAVPETQRRLEEQREELERENERLRRQAETTERLLGVASGLLRGRTQMRARSVKTKTEDE
jgi:transposase-like protein